MAQAKEPAPINKSRPETLLLAVTKDGTIKLGLPPRDPLDNYPARAKDVGKLRNASHVLCSPEGELFCVRGGDLYRGPLPSKKGVDWFSIARRVGQWEWNQFSFLFFHPNGDLYGVTYGGSFYIGPQPDNENVPWMCEQARKILVSESIFAVFMQGWRQCLFLFFDPCGVLYAVNRDWKLVKGNPPTTTTQTYQQWLKTCTVVREFTFLGNRRFISICPDGNLWNASATGIISRGPIPDVSDGAYISDGEHLGGEYKNFRFFSFTKDKTITSITSFEFLPERGIRVSESPEVIEQKIYYNRSSTVLKHTFTVDKTVKMSSSFSRDHGFTFEIGSELTWKAGIPSITKNETSVHMNLSTTHNWSFANTNETEEKISSGSEVDVPPGKAIRMEASVMKAELIVPYRARVRTLFGSEKEIEGIWKGATVYNLTVTQEDYGNQELRQVEQEQIGGQPLED